MENFHSTFPEGLSLSELLHAMQQQNLVYNSRFVYFSNVINLEQNQYGIPDGWIYNDTGTGGEINLEDGNCKIITGKGDNMVMTFSQSLHEFPRWKSKLRGQSVTAKVQLKLLYSAEICLSLTDGIGTNTRKDNCVGDLELEVQLAISAEAKSLKLIIECTTPSATIYLKKVYANLGNIALENLPCIVNGVIGERKQYFSTKNSPPEELSLCNEGTQLNDDYSRLDSVINKRFGTTVDGKYSLLPDLRGYFSRSWNNGSDRDPDTSNRVTPGNKERTGDYVGTVEEDAFEEHNHTINCSIAGAVKLDGTIDVMGSNGTINSQKTGGKETRPKNFAELYTVKWA